MTLSHCLLIIRSTQSRARAAGFLSRKITSLIENRDKNLDKRESEREKGTRTRCYGKYENVILTAKEYHALISDYPDEYMDMIEHLSAYMASTGRTYENHLATMERWKVEDRKKAKKEGYVYNSSFKEGESL